MFNLADRFKNWIAFMGLLITGLYMMFNSDIEVRSLGVFILILSFYKFCITISEEIKQIKKSIR